MTHSIAAPLLAIQLYTRRASRSFASHDIVNYNADNLR